MKNILDYETNDERTIIIYWDDVTDMIIEHVVPKHRHLKEG